MSADTITRPALRYHGGKYLLAPWIISHFPRHRVYVEPYGGAMSVLLQKARSYAEVYNERDDEIVNVFRVLRDPEQSIWLRRALRLTPFSRTEFEESYLPHTEPVERARRTIVRSFMGFGSAAASANATGFRSNSHRSGTTPAHDWRNYAEALPALTRRLDGVVIENRDARQVMIQHDSAETLHYVDPPYPFSTRSQGNIYNRKGYRFEMTDDDHRDLAETLRAIEGMVVLSGYPCDLYDEELYPDWRRVARVAFADGARERTEVLWLSPSASARLQPELFDSLSYAEGIP